MNPNDDPGWRPALRPWWQLLVPWFPLFRKRHWDLVGLRAAFIYMGLTLVQGSIAAVWVFSEAGDEARFDWIIVGVPVPLAVALSIWSWRTWQIPAGPADRVALAFRTQMFVSLGLAESPGLAGIAAIFIYGDPWNVVVGALASLLLMTWFGPRRSRVDEVQDRPRAAGSPVSLRTALEETP